MIKAILLDIDGTLTNSDKEITPRTRDALLRAQDAGVTLVLASGRPALGLRTFAEQLRMYEHDGLFCCFNGARVLNCQTDEVYVNQVIALEQAKRLLAHTAAFDVNPLVDDGDEYMHTLNACLTIPGPSSDRWMVCDYEAHNNGYLLMEHRDLAAAIDFEPNKINVVGAPDYLKEHAAAIAAPFEGELNSMFTAPMYFEFTPMGVDKAKSLATTFELLGIDAADTAAFGDAENDTTMLALAGHGVAMGNAVDATKAVAEFVTEDNDHDGIAVALERLMPELWA